MDDFRTSAPEPRGPPNPNVEYIPFEEMKERILKIVTGFNGYVSFVFYNQDNKHISPVFNIVVCTVSVTVCFASLNR